MRTQLDWGQGGVSAILDFSTGELHYYQGATKFRDAVPKETGRFVDLHQLYGGEQYYQSLSGLSGAGYITAPHAVRIGTYRVDRRNNPHADSVMGWSIYAPYHYRADGFEARDWPVVATKDDMIAVMSSLRLRDLVLGEASIEAFGEELWHERDVLMSPLGDTKLLRRRIVSDCQENIWQKVLRRYPLFLLNGGRYYFFEAEFDELPHGEKAWWYGLGLGKEICIWHDARYIVTYRDGFAEKCEPEKRPATLEEARELYPGVFWATPDTYISNGYLFAWGEDPKELSPENQLRVFAGLEPLEEDRGKRRPRRDRSATR